MLIMNRLDKSNAASNCWFSCRQGAFPWRAAVACRGIMIPLLIILIAASLTGCAVTRRRIVPLQAAAPVAGQLSSNKSIAPTQTKPDTVGTKKPVAGKPLPATLYNSVAEIQILKLRMPLGLFTGNKKIWRILAPVDASNRTTALLKANGFRCGTASFKQWRKIAPWINKPGTTSQRIYCQIAGTRPVALTVHSNIQRELLAYVDSHNTLTLRTYRGCDNEILMAAHLLTTSPDTVLQLEPAVKLGTVTFARGPHTLGLMQGTRPVEHLFARMQLTLRIAPHHFVVLAAADAVGKPASIGSAFLSETRRIPPRETVLLFIPMNHVK